VIRCRGRMVSGAEVGSLQSELQKLTEFRKRVVLQLAEADYIDSAGLGALVRLFGVLRAAGGDLKLCQLSSFVLQVLRVSNLLSIFRTYASEKEAIEAFSERARYPKEACRPSRTGIVCIDTSSDLLAYVNVQIAKFG
jgi:anti-sigma B factor antagonist